MYDFVLFLHLTGVALLILSLSYSLGGFFVARRARTVAGVRSALTFVPIVEKTIGPAMLLLLASGLYMVGKLHWGWGTGWVDVAIAIFVLMGFLGNKVEGKRIEAIREQVAELPDGPVPAEVDALRHDPILTHVAFFGAFQVWAFLYLMTNKPGWGGAIATVAIAGSVSLVPARLALRPAAPVATDGSVATDVAVS